MIDQIEPGVPVGTAPPAADSSAVLRWVRTTCAQKCIIDKFSINLKSDQSDVKTEGPPLLV
jgi:hypothetical protein